MTGVLSLSAFRGTATPAPPAARGGDFAVTFLGGVTLADETTRVLAGVGVAVEEETLFLAGVEEGVLTGAEGGRTGDFAAALAALAAVAFERLLLGLKVPFPLALRLGFGRGSLPAIRASDAAVGAYNLDGVFGRAGDGVGVTAQSLHAADGVAGGERLGALCRRDHESRCGAGPVAR